MNIEKIGKFIKEKRIEKKLTQEELANKVYVTNKAVSRWENGKSIPEVETLYLLSKELDVSINEILEAGENTKEEVKKYFDKKRIKEMLPDILIFIFVALIPVLYIFFTSNMSIELFVANLGFENLQEFLSEVINADQYTRDFINNTLVSFTMSWILVIISYVGYKLKNKIVFYIPFVINILTIIIFEIFNFCFPELLDNLMINMNLCITLLVINIIELRIIKKINK